LNVLDGQRGRRQRSRAGFTLLEVLVALAILALAFGVLLQIFSTGLRTVDTGDVHARAIAVAESVLAGIGPDVPLEPGASGGVNADFYIWNYAVSPAPGEFVLEDDERVFEVVVTVRWGKPPKGGSVELKTLRVAQER